ncbi:MAG TPA: NAD+ synthase [Miltoncostaeaceae bacterium]|nr:NAD+ synthase [Miltoncostaeaceae bacterium]
MRVALAQINTVVGDIDGNAGRVAAALADAGEAGADVTLVPELAISGYPPEDLLLRPAFAAACREALVGVAAGVGRGLAVIGFPEWDGDCHNSAAVVADGRVQAVYRKRFLPNYGVFDEARYFRAGDGPMVLDALGARIGIAICEDIWYPSPVASDLAAARVDLVCCISASPYHRGKGDRREQMLATRADDCAAALAFCNLVGGQDELVFDGRSVLFDAAGEIVARAAQFDERLLVADVDLGLSARRRLREPLARRLPTPAAAEAVRISASRAARNGAAPGAARGEIAPALRDEPEVWAALRTGLRDYVGKNRFPGVLVGLSGGIDSALTAALAADALGADRVTGVAMPSSLSSPESLAGAEALAESLAIRLMQLPIAPVVGAFDEVLAEAFAGREPDITEENIQARARGTLLMALSNKLGLMVLATGNKSEISVGYSTLYGDMVGGFAPLRDLSKTWVYRLARWRNASEGREVVPEATIARPPTAELRPGQLDTDSLPPYDVLDAILEGYVEQGLEPDDLVRRGHPEIIVAEVVRMVDRAEYKRRQGPVGIKITPRAFGRDRRMPITTRHV